MVNRTAVSQEIRESLRLLPVSWLLHNALPGSISFQDWFRLSAPERRARWDALNRLAPVLRTQPSDLLNYEAQQAPLAYFLLVPIDSAASRLELCQRIFVLRLFVAITSALFLLVAANLLLRAFAVDGPFRIAALACIFESQMLWASIAHVDNDWLAIPLSACFLALLVLAARDSRPRYLLLLAALLTAGLLTKAYFLAFVPIFAAFLILRFLRRQVSLRTALLSLVILLLAAPWYARNAILYGSLSGTQETVAGVSFHRLAGAFVHINWITSTIDLFRWALWTGNWSFVSFSRLTLNTELFLLAAAFILFCAHLRQIRPGEWWAMAACCAFFVGLMYQTCVTWVATNGRAQHAEPWYLQCILPCLWALVFLSLQQSGVLGRILAAAIVSISAWVAAATYLLKLIPLYGGFTGRANIPAVLLWYRHLPLETLSQTVLGPLSLLFVALAVFLLLLAVLTIALLRVFIPGRNPQPSQFRYNLPSDPSPQP